MLPSVGERPLPVSSDMTRLRPSSGIAALAALSLLLLAGSALAQDQRGPGNFLDNLFNRGEPSSRDSGQPGPSGRGPQPDPSDLSVRLDRMENALRQLTGTIEQLQYRNQQLEMQIQQLGARGAAAPAPQAAPVGPGSTPPLTSNPGRRSDVFDPSQTPNAPGAPRTLGNPAVIAAPESIQDNAPPVGAPGGRAAGAPLDLSTVAGNDASPRPQAAAPPAAVASANGGPVPPAAMPAPAQMPSAPIRNVAPAAPAGAQLATLPPSASPQDEYDMAYGYVLHKDYSLAEQSFRDFLKKYPNQRLVPEAQYWLGESLFQQQRYRDAAESFLGVSTKFERSGKAPDALLRLGQSLAAMNQKEAACATLAEVGRKYPRASAGVKRGVEQEQKRAHC
jgi:tol-pal system protein YbgF